MKYLSQGFGLVEIIVAVALFVTIATVGIVTVLGSFTSNRLGDEETEAALYAQEGIEAARSIVKQGWSTPFLAISCASGCGLSSSGSWSWSGTSDTRAPFTRVVTVSSVQRDGSGDVVTSGGTDDPDTKKVSSTVTWDFTTVRSNTVDVVTYVTNFEKILGSSWGVPQVLGTIDFTSGNSGNANADAISVAYKDNFIFVGRASSGGTELIAVDISTPAAPSICATCTRELNGDVKDIEISGNYAYIASTNDAQELQIINISNPATLSTASLSTFDLTAGNSGNANADPVAISILGSDLYMIRAGGNEFIRFNISSPTAPILVGTDSSFSGIPTDMIIANNAAFVTSDDNSREIQVFDLSTLAQLGFSNMSSGDNKADALSIEVGPINHILVGRQSSKAPELYSYDITNTSNSLLSSTMEIGFDVTDISYGNALVFSLTSDSSKELKIVDGVDMGALPTTFVSEFDLSNNPADHMYEPILDMIFSVGSSDSNEVEIVQGI